MNVTKGPGRKRKLTPSEIAEIIERGKIWQAAEAHSPKAIAAEKGVSVTLIRGIVAHGQNFWTMAKQWQAQAYWNRLQRNAQPPQQQ